MEMMEREATLSTFSVGLTILLSHEIFYVSITSLTSILSIYLLFCVVGGWGGAESCGWWDFNSSIRDQTHGPGNESTKS